MAITNIPSGHYTQNNKVVVTILMGKRQQLVQRNIDHDTGHESLFFPSIIYRLATRGSVESVMTPSTMPSRYPSRRISK